MDKSTRIVVFSAIALLIAGMALYPRIKKHFRKEESAQQAPSPSPGGGRGAPLNVNAQVIAPELLVDRIRVSTAYLIPDEEVDLTFETSGKITDIHFKEGSPVKKGELLAKVNDKPLVAELQKLKAQIPLAEDRVFRQKSLLEKDAVSQEAYEQVRTELDKLHADIELAEARIAQTELRAPFDGIIGLRNVSEGAYASPTTVISRLTKISPMKIEFSVSEKEADMIAAGTPITFQTPPDLQTYNARIYAVESRLDMNTYTLKARALYPNTDGRLRPGRSATVDINAGEVNDALTVPNESVVKEMGRDIAYLYSDGRARQVELTLGRRGSSHVQVLEGLSPGDTLIVTGVMQLRGGLPVKINSILQ